MPPIAVDIPGYTPQSMYDNALKDGCKKALEFASRHRIAASDCHIAEGSLDEVIVDECKKLNPTALFLEMFQLQNHLNLSYLSLSKDIANSTCRVCYVSVFLSILIFSLKESFLLISYHFNSF